MISHTDIHTTESYGAGIYAYTQFVLVFIERICNFCMAHMTVTVTVRLDIFDTKTNNKYFVTEK